MAKKPVKPVKKKATKKEKSPAAKTGKKKTLKKTPKKTAQAAKAPAKKKTVKQPVKIRKEKKPKAVSKIAKPRAAKAAQKAEAAEKDRQNVLRKLLILNREKIVEEAKTEIAKYIKGETRQLVESVLDDGDWSVIDLSEDINLRRLATHREVLLKIDEALRKLREGTYGICEDCGEEINTKRLKVLPFAIYCRDCQERREELEKVGTEEL